MPRPPEKFDLLIDIIVDALVRQALESGDPKNDDENETPRTPAGSIDSGKRKRERKRSGEASAVSASRENR